MSIFGKKKKEEKSTCVGAGEEKTVKGAADTKNEGAVLKVLGGGCAKCNALEAAAKQALTELGLPIEIEHVTDFSVIASYGVMTTPALVYNEKVLCYGKVLKKDEIVKLLKQN